MKAFTGFMLGTTIGTAVVSTAFKTKTKAKVEKKSIFENVRYYFDGAVATLESESNKEVARKEEVEKIYKRWKEVNQGFAMGDTGNYEKKEYETTNFAHAKVMMLNQLPLTTAQKATANALMDFAYDVALHHEHTANKNIVTSTVSAEGL